MPRSPQPVERAPRVLEIERFEQVRASAERVLLRLDGRYVASPGRRILDATLFVDDGLAVHRHAPLPDPDSADPGSAVWLWRAAFAVPASYLTDARTSFALEAEAGVLVGLEQPHAGKLLESLPASRRRTAGVARRYAAVLAVLVAVAVSPGALPANARTEVLKVRRADGSIVYLTTDGRQLSMLPPDAEIIDQTAGSPAAAPAPGGAPSTSPSAPAPAQGDANQTRPIAPAPGAGGSAGGGGAPSPRGARVVVSDSATRSSAGAKRTPRSTRTVSSSQGGRSSHQSEGPGQGRATGAAAGRSAALAHQPTTPARPSARTTPAQMSDAIAGAPQLASGPQLVVNEVSVHLKPLALADQPLPLSVLGSSRGLKPLSGLVAASMPGVGPSDLHSQGQLDAAGAGGATPPLEPISGSVGQGGVSAPIAGGGQSQPHSSDHQRAPQPESTPAPRQGEPAPAGGSRPVPAAPAPQVGASAPAPTALPSGGPNPFDVLPGALSVTSVPNFVIDSFHIPPFLLPIYQAAAVEYGIGWEVLAAVNEIETDYGRNLSVSSAGALGWMQFMPDTWKMYGVDANRDGKRDPYNPVDAIFATARYLRAAGGDTDIRSAIFAYNHASWYVDSVMLRARLIAAYPPPLINALTGLTQGRFPIAAPAHYSGEAGQNLHPVPAGQNAANVVSSDATGKGTDIYARPGSPVIAVGDGIIKDIGREPGGRGYYVVLQDAYGNEYTYEGLGSLSKLYPVPKIDVTASDASASGSASSSVTAPTEVASAGIQGGAGTAPPAAPRGKGAAQQAPIVGAKKRLFAHPERPGDAASGGLEQMLESGSQPYETYGGYFADALGLDSHNAILRPLRKGAPVIATTVLGHLGADQGNVPAHIHFRIRPSGKGAPQIDPTPILDGWRLLESTDIYNANGKTARGKGAANLTIGEMMLLPKPLLERRVLSDSRIKIYAGGRADIKTGQVDRRVLELLEYLAESGLKPTVSSLKSGHSAFTTSGSVSEHASGNAVDISAINDIPIAGHQDPGGIAEQTVKRLMTLQGALRPDRIISLINHGQNTVSARDHGDHIEVGFQPLFGDNAKAGAAALSVLAPDQWQALAKQLGQISNPVVSATPSQYAIPGA